MLILFMLISVWIDIASSDYSLDTECNSVTGNPAINRGYKSEAVCGDGFTMVSCGTKESQSVPHSMAGAYIVSNNKCVATKITDSSDKLYSVARCCRLHPAVSCATVQEISASSGSFKRTTSFCYQPDQVLFGCGASNAGQRVGSVYDVYATFPSLLYGFCKAMNDMDVKENNRGIFAEGRCCKSTNPSTVKLQCKHKTGPRAPDSSSAITISTVKCDDKWFMTSCGGKSIGSPVHAWFIDNDGTCNAYKYGSKGGQEARAICCQEIIIETPPPTPATVPITTSSRGYFLGPDMVNFDEAENYCKSKGSHLASIHNELEFERARSLCMTVGEKANCAVGIYQESEGKPWRNRDATSIDYGFNVDGTATTGIKPWGIGEPNELTHHSGCVLFSSYKGFMFNNCRCDAPSYPLCTDKICQNNGGNAAMSAPYKSIESLSSSSSYSWRLRSELDLLRNENSFLYIISFGLFILAILACIGMICSCLSKQNAVIPGMHVYNKTFQNDPDEV